MANFDMANRFLALFDSGDIFTFQTFDDSKKRRSGSLARVFHGTFEQHKEALACLNANGAGVFFMVNCGDGIINKGKTTCRTADNVTLVRSLFVDLDGAPLQPVKDALFPDIIVESSTNKWHCYWLTNDCPLSDFKERQLQIAQLFDGDPAVHDLPRVMRLPGFFHQKNDPVMTTLIYPENQNGNP